MGETAVIGSKEWALALGQTIKVRRIDVGMSRQQLADASSISYSYLSAIEIGAKTPSTKIMQVMQIMNGHVMATMQVPVLVDRLSELEMPVLGFWGMDEKMMPENGIMAMAKNIKYLRLLLVTECGHWVMVEHEDMFNRACLDFLAHG